MKKKTASSQDIQRLSTSVTGVFYRRGKLCRSEGHTYRQSTVSNRGKNTTEVKHPNVENRSGEERT